MKKICIVCIVMTFFTACEIFKPRGAEAPDAPAPWNPFPTTSQMCVDNLLYSYNYLKRNIHQYNTIFTDDFRFYFDEQDVSDFTLPSFWDKRDEVEMLINASQRNEAFTLTLEKLSEDSSTNFVTYRFSYTLDGNIISSGAGIAATGDMLVTVAQINGLWRINEWRDYRIPAELSFGRVKNEYAS